MRNAKRRNLVVSITPDFYLKKTQEKCYYCGNGLMGLAAVSGYNGAFSYNGLDRIDNTKGYTEENVVTCCKHCNRAKDTMLQEDFIAMAHRIAQLHPTKGIIT